MVDQPSGTVTFLFTDLERSTPLWEHHPDEMRAALARHDEILRSAVKSHGGAVVKTTGDGLHAVFGTASDAVAAAVLAQRALTGERWLLPEALRVRMGLHTGHAEMRGGDYYGPAVNRAARVAGAAHAGQILVSAATAELLDRWALRDLGEYRLRGLPPCDCTKWWLPNWQSSSLPSRLPRSASNCRVRRRRSWDVTPRSLSLDSSSASIVSSP
jgi:class 3 adenylate cyclase